MGWVKIEKYDRCKTYGCAKPVPTRGQCGEGSIWECDLCQTRWRITKWNSDQRDGDYPSWEKIIPRSIPPRYI
jgi:hypothetical protein